MRDDAQKAWDALGLPPTRFVTLGAVEERLPAWDAKALQLDWPIRPAFWEAKLAAVLHLVDAGIVERPSSRRYLGAPLPAENRDARKLIGKLIAKVKEAEADARLAARSYQSGLQFQPSWRDLLLPLVEISEGQHHTPNRPAIGVAALKAQYENAGAEWMRQVRGWYEENARSHIGESTLYEHKKYVQDRVEAIRRGDLTPQADTARIRELAVRVGLLEPDSE